MRHAQGNNQLQSSLQAYIQKGHLCEASPRQASDRPQADAALHDSRARSPHPALCKDAVHRLLLNEPTITKALPAQCSTPATASSASETICAKEPFITILASTQDAPSNLIESDRPAGLGQVSSAGRCQVGAATNSASDATSAEGSAASTLHIRPAAYGQIASQAQWLEAPVQVLLSHADSALHARVGSDSLQSLSLQTVRTPSGAHSPPSSPLAQNAAAAELLSTLLSWAAPASTAEVVPTEQMVKQPKTAVPLAAESMSPQASATHSVALGVKEAPACEPSSIFGSPAASPSSAGEAAADHQADQSAAGVEADRPLPRATDRVMGKSAQRAVDGAADESESPAADNELDSGVNVSDSESGAGYSAEDRPEHNAVEAATTEGTIRASCTDASSVTMNPSAVQSGSLRQHIAEDPSCNTTSSTAASSPASGQISLVLHSEASDKECLPAADASLIRLSPTPAAASLRTALMTGKQGSDSGGALLALRSPPSSDSRDSMQDR